jgi:hypothetical protein
MSGVCVLAACGETTSDPDAGELRAIDAGPRSDAGNDGGSSVADAGVDAGQLATDSGEPTSDADVPRDTVELTLENAPADLSAHSIYVVYRDGDGPWTTAPAPASPGRFELPIAASRYGVAIGYAGNTDAPFGLPTVSLYFATKVETTRIVHVLPIYEENLPESTARLRGELGASVGDVAAGWHRRIGVVSAWELPVLPGTFEVVGCAGIGYWAGCDQIDVIRGVRVEGEVVTDLAPASSLETVSIDAPSDSGDGPAVTTVLITEHGTLAPLRYFDTGAAVLPESERDASDLYKVTVSFQRGDGAGNYQYSGDTRWLASPAGESFALPIGSLGEVTAERRIEGELERAAFRVASVPTARAYVFRFSGDASWRAAFSAGWFEGAAEIDVVLPAPAELGAWAETWTASNASGHLVSAYESELEMGALLGATIPAIEDDLDARRLSGASIRHSSRHAL